MSRGYHKQLRREVQSWRDEGLISPEQSDMILARYPASKPINVVYLIYLFAALLAGLGIILLVAANWAGLPRLVRLGVIQALVIASYFSGYRVLNRGNQPLGTGLLFLGTMCFGAGILLVGQMFHIIYYDAYGFLYWAVATAAASLLVRSRFIFVAAVAQLTVYGVAGATRYNEFFWFYPVFLLLIVPFLALNPTTPVLAAGIASLTLTTMVIIGASGLGPDAAILYGLFLLALIRFLPRRSPAIDTVLTVFGTAAGFFGVVAVASGANISYAIGSAVAVILILAAVVVRSQVLREPISTLAPLLLFIPYFALAGVRGFPINYVSLIGLGVFAVVLMLTGARLGLIYHVNLGSAYLLLTILITYVQFAREFLSAAVLFLSSGLVLFAIGWLIERSRRRLIGDPDRRETP